MAKGRFDSLVEEDGQNVFKTWHLTSRFQQPNNLLQNEDDFCFDSWKSNVSHDNYRLQAAIMSRYFCLKIVAMSIKVLGARSLKRQHLKLLCVEHSNGCKVGIYGIVRKKLKNLQMSLIHILLTHPRQFYHLHDSFEKKKLCALKKMEFLLRRQKSFTRMDSLIFAWQYIWNIALAVLFIW